VSYVFTGEESIDPAERENPSQMRIFADNEDEGDEDPGISLYRYSYGCGQACWCRCGRLNARPLECNNPGDGTLEYHYVGGLEDEDNHATDGVNVLYLDWHVEFDSRAWPSPIGMLKTDQWQKYRWCGETVKHEQYVLPDGKTCLVE